MWQPCTFSNKTMWSALSRRTWSSVTRPDPIPEAELGKCETREIIFVLFFPLLTNSRHLKLVLGYFRSFLCALLVLEFTFHSCLVQGIFWWRYVNGSLGQYAAYNRLIYSRSQKRFKPFFDVLERSRLRGGLISSTELFGVSWILRTASFNFDQLSGFGQVGLCTWSFNQPRYPSHSWTTM